MEGVLAERLEALLVAGELPDLQQLRAEFAPRTIELPQIAIELPAASQYDALLPSRYEPHAVAV